MFKIFCLSFLFFFAVWELSEGITCYKCYTLTKTEFHFRKGDDRIVSVTASRKKVMRNETLTFPSSDITKEDETLDNNINVVCADKMTESNTLQCPEQFSYCGTFHFKSRNPMQEEIVRTCAGDEAGVTCGKIGKCFKSLLCNDTELCNI